MQDLTPEEHRIVDDMARRHGVGRDAVLALLRALTAGNGTMAQFNHPDLGGMGQWSRGGMIMVGDMFDQDLKRRVGALCSELAESVRGRPMPLSGGSGQSQSQGRRAPGISAGSIPSAPAFGSPSGVWWPVDLGAPSSTGAQDGLQYAVFPGARRLAVRQGGRVTLYDTGDHRIAGVSQRQGRGPSLTFTSQHGPVRLADLPVITSTAGAPTQPSAAASPEPHPASAAPSSPPPRPQAKAAPAADDLLAAVERLADLHRKGVLTEEEFSAKKAELLRRL